jgi:hypothetical protein
MVYLHRYQKSPFGYILETLGMENFGIFYGKMVYLTPFGVFSRFGMFYQDKV